MTKTEAAASIRAFIKAQGFKASVSGLPGYGGVRVVVPSYEARFTGEQIAAFCGAARDIGLTFVRGTPIHPGEEANLTGKQQWEFYL